MLSSYALRSGSMIKSPALVGPPKNTKASGLQNSAKFAQALPRVSPVNANISVASSSPCCAALVTSTPVISSGLRLLSMLGLPSCSSFPRAVRAIPVP